MTILPKPLARCSLVLLAAAAPMAAQGAYEGYYRYIGSHPTDAEPGYQDDLQGVTTDGVFWYLTQAGDKFDPDDEENALWKIPVALDLDTVSEPGGSVERVILGDTPLGDRGFVHLGDLSWFRSPGGVEYLVIAVEGPVSPCGDVIALFRADDLSYVADFPVCDVQEHAPWVAVDSEGFLYSSNYKEHDGQPVVIEKYEVDWDELEGSGNLLWHSEATFQLVDENGSPPADLWGVQGGVMSPSDELMFLTVYGPTEPCESQNGGGIWAFSTEGASEWQRVARSVNGPGVFSYEYDPCENIFGEPVPEEPEGLTIWDFDGGQAPGIAGQLHVILLNNDTFDDNWHFRHYTNKVFVPGQANDVAAAVDYAWDGARLRIAAGSYPEPFVCEKRVRLEAMTPPVVLGE